MRTSLLTRIIYLVCLTGILLLPTAYRQQTELLPASEKAEKIIGADISFLPQLEQEGIKFSVDGKQQDALLILKEHGFNYIRLRIFVDPAADSGYSKKGYCSLEQTAAMAKRIKAANLKFLLNFHYSDTWADPQKQFKPAAWKNLSFSELTKKVHDYTKDVMTTLKKQGTLPDMVQIGNEISNGMLWPDGDRSHPDNLAALVKAGIAGSKEVGPEVKIMLHIALGGQNAESRTWLDNMISRGVEFDIIGQSYYPQWHGTISDLKNNLTDLSTRYPQDVVVAEYTQHKQKVNDIAFNLPKGTIKGTFIWEPLNTWEEIFDKNGEAIDYLLNVYPALAKKYSVN
ncbi:MAG TPA: glycosyl hydrolase 53 family protein [Chitinophagales bacterium]|nr:glycosyl hydrolase 53 family protein [Chitinophagales bacterium]